jgi:hypothetical protein
MKILNSILFVLCFAATAANAQNKSHMIGLGPSRVLDTYLTPENFSGTGFTYMYIKEQQDSTRHWSNTYEHEVDLSNTHDRSDNINDLEITYNLYWARYYNFSPIFNGLKLQAGVAANLCAGAIYNMTSSNNPAQARAALNIMPSATATYDFHISRQRFTTRYELNLPLVGVMFSPNYGQSYYEIFSRGNYDHNIVPTTFISAPTFRQLISVDWHYSNKWSLRLAYLGNYQQAQVNNLKQHTYTHRFLIGLTRSL